MEKEKPMSHVFRPGDKVKAPAFYGDRIFTLQECADETYTLQIFGDHETACESFTADGRVSVYHTHPVLTLVEAKKEPVKVECPIDFTAPHWGLQTALAGPRTLPLPAEWTNLLIGKRGRLTFVESEGE